MGVVAKRSSMMFYTSNNDHYGHSIKIVLAEKGVAVDVIEAALTQIPPEVMQFNPHKTLPILVDRDLILHEQNVIMEYLDERFPHPPLLPVYPVARAQSRMWIHRIQRDWSARVDAILSGKLSDAEKEKCREELLDSFASVSPIFSHKPYFMSDDFTLVDCCVAPILWRLSELEIQLPKKKCAHLSAYADRLFRRVSFQASLSKLDADKMKDLFVV